MRPVKNLSTLYVYITNVVSANLDSHLFVPKGLIREKVEETLKEVFTEKEKTELVNLYGALHENDFNKLQILCEECSLLSPIFSKEEEEEFNSLNKKLYESILDKLNAYYRTESRYKSTLGLQMLISAFRSSRLNRIRYLYSAILLIVTLCLIDLIPIEGLMKASLFISCMCLILLIMYIWNKKYT